MKKNFIRLLSFAICLVMTLCVFDGCTSKKSETEDTTTTASSTLVDPKWIIGPTIEAESIEPLVRADYNENTRHYDISYADCFKIKHFTFEPCAAEAVPADDRIYFVHPQHIDKCICCLVVA